MAQVSETSTSPQEALNTLRAKNPEQNQKPPTDNGAVNEKASQSASAATETRETDKVRISREAQEQDRESRASEGKRNSDSLRPPSEQIENERGAAQKLRDQESNESRRAREFQEASLRTDPGNPNAGESDRAGESRQSRNEGLEAAENRGTLERQAVDERNPEVQLREFESRDEVRIEPQVVAESVDEIAAQREKAEAAKEPVLEAPSQRIIQEDAGGRSPSTRSAENNAENDQQERDRQASNPVSVQTETGQNVDDLI